MKRKTERERFADAFRRVYRTRNSEKFWEDPLWYFSLRIWRAAKRDARRAKR